MRPEWGCRSFALNWDTTSERPESLKGPLTGCRPMYLALKLNFEFIVSLISIFDFFVGVGGGGVGVGVASKIC